AFATWMAYKIVDGWRPEWRLWLDFGVGTAAAMQLDALKSTHPIRAEVHNADEATESFDLITYEKGGAVLRMIEGFLSAEKFREGIRGYMKEFGQKNAVADDLWNALSKASGQPVVELANAWIRREGFPIISVKRDGTKLQLSQRRFFSEPGVQGEGVWPVPMVIRFKDSTGVKEQRHLLRNASEELTLNASGDIRWLVANADSSGFYRVSYDAAGLTALGNSLQELGPSERVSLLADNWAQVRSGMRSLGDFLSLAEKFQGERDYAVLNELVGRFSAIEHRLLDEKDRGAFEKLIEKLFGSQLDAVGWGSDKDPDELKLQRAALLRAVGLLARRKTTATEAARRLDESWTGNQGMLEANLHGTAVSLAARDGDSKRFDAFLSKHKAEQDPSFRRRYLMALASFEAPELAKRAIELAFTDTVPAQDFSTYVASLLSNRTAREPAWKLVQERWNDVLQKTGNAPMILRRVIESFGLLPDRSHFHSVKGFLTTHHVEALKAGIAQTLERMEQDVALRDRAMPELSSWLRAR
ncbi:MAG: M1 family metallopeptidase, partial [Myxococcaceae bacterium]